MLKLRSLWITQRFLQNIYNSNYYYISYGISVRGIQNQKMFKLHRKKKRLCILSWMIQFVLITEMLSTIHSIVTEWLSYRGKNKALKRQRKVISSTGKHWSQAWWQMEHCFSIISSPVFSLKPLWGKGHILITGHSQSIYCSSISVAIVSVTPWTVACQVPLSIEFTRQKYWSG